MESDDGENIMQVIALKNFSILCNEELLDNFLHSIESEDFSKDISEFESHTDEDIAQIDFDELVIIETMSECIKCTNETSKN